MIKALFCPETRNYKSEIRNLNVQTICNQYCLVFRYSNIPLTLYFLGFPPEVKPSILVSYYGEAKLSQHLVKRFSKKDYSIYNPSYSYWINKTKKKLPYGVKGKAPMAFFKFLFSKYFFKNPSHKDCNENTPYW